MAPNRGAAMPGGAGTCFEGEGESPRLSQERRESYAEAAKSYGENECAILETGKEKETRAILVVTPQTAKARATTSAEFRWKRN